MYALPISHTPQAHRIANLERDIANYELAVELYDEYLATGTLRSGRDIEELLVDPETPGLNIAIEMFLNNTGQRRWTDRPSPERLRVLVQNNRETAMAELERYRDELEELINLPLNALMGQQE
ncbi:hypothetical protein BGZ65_000919 [Modicella reniformis]|uniref:Uncharacterized protein n=1 Tax=Modicella reniformis TaxID=1440133 RepID=A0A9P6J5H5_9FUNG|nr:hypothetical protein BGZ65_000919 [Modicella reniformis]